MRRSKAPVVGDNTGRSLGAASDLDLVSRCRIGKRHSYTQKRQAVLPQEDKIGRSIFPKGDTEAYSCVTKVGHLSRATE